MANSTTVQLGKDGVLYRNTGSWGSPTFVAWTNVADLEVSLDADEADGTSRGSGGFYLMAVTLIKAVLNFTINYDKADAAWIALQAAFFGRSTLDLFAADAAAGNLPQGFRALYQCVKFSKKEPLKDIQKQDISCKPTAIGSANPPVWYTSLT